MTILAEDVFPSAFAPVFLYEITASDGAVIAPAYVPMTLGTYTLGTLPYAASPDGEVTLYYSDADWTESQSTPPDLTLDFTNAMPAGVTFTRSGNAWGWDKNKQFTQYGNNVPRVAQTDEIGNPCGILLEGARTNMVDHSIADGAVIGVVGGSGSMPLNWFVEWDAGLLFNVVGSGTDNGMPYVDINMSGIGATSTPVIITLVGFDAVPMASGQTWTGSVFAKKVGGSLNNINGFNCRVSGFNTVSRNQTEYSETPFTVSDGGFSRGKHTRTMNSASTDAGTVEITIDIDLGVPINFTIRLSLPQLEQARFASSPIPTSGGSATRNAEACYLPTSGAWLDATANTIAAEVLFDSISTYNIFGRILYSFDDNTPSNLFINSLYGTTEILLVNNLGAQVVNIGNNSPAAYSKFKTASKFKTSDYRHRTSTGVAAFTSASGALPSVNQLCIGSYARGNEPLYGYFNKLMIWKGLVDNTLIDSISTSEEFPPNWARSASARKNIHYEGRCENLGMDRTIPLTPESSSRSILSVGEIPINNTDGLFDSIIATYAVDGRNISVKLLPDTSMEYGQAISMFDGIGVNWIADNDKVSVTIREKSFSLDVPLLGIFGGTGGGDGTAASVGRVIPQAYGICRNITSELVDPAKLIYRFHDRLANDVLAVYDRGAPITRGNSYATYSLLAAAATAAGTYDYAMTATGSYYRIGSSPSGTVTADVQGDASGGYVSKTGSIIQRLLLRGTLIGSIDTAALAAIDSSIPGDIGIYFNNQLNISDAIDQVCQGTFTFWGDIGEGLIGCYQLTDPTGITPDFEIGEYCIVDDISPIQLPETIGPTVWRRSIGYKINWTQQSGTDIVPAPTITDARRKELQEVYKKISIGDSSRLIKNMLAIDAPDLVSIFDSSTDATNLANTILSLYKPGRQLLSVPVSLVGYKIKLNDVVFLKWPRFNLASGALFRVVGISYQGTTVNLTLFG